jgi:hypothetical protein
VLLEAEAVGMAAVMLVRKVVLAEVVEPRMFGLVE